MRIFALTFLLLLASTYSIAQTAPAPSTPNVVIILADDLGYGSVGCYGADPKLVRTPHIDNLAKEGMRFMDMNTTSSVCTPTRYSLLTGRYCWRTALKSGALGTFDPLLIEPARLNLASMLKAHGYATAAIGKWHLGYGDGKGDPKYRTDYSAELKPGPLELGFDYHFSVPQNHGDASGVYVQDHFVYGLRSGKIPEGLKLPGPALDDENFPPTYESGMQQGKGRKPMEIDAPRRKDDHVMPELTQQVLQWIGKQKPGKPFFLYYTPVAVHEPVTPSQDLKGSSAAGSFGDWIHQLDRSVGQVLEALEKQGLARDTLIIFTSDNGGIHEPKQKRPEMVAVAAGLAVNGKFRGGKTHVYEGGFKVPFIARWPGHVPPGTESKDDMLSLADVLATVAAIVGEKLPAPQVAAEDSLNFLPLLLGGKSAKAPRQVMVLHSNDGVFAIRKGPWKWIEGVPVKQISPGTRKEHAAEFVRQLYNVEKDPGETQDVSARHPGLVQELEALLKQQRDQGCSR